MLSISIPRSPRRAVEKGRKRLAPSPQWTSSPRIRGSSASRSTFSHLAETDPAREHGHAQQHRSRLPSHARRSTRPRDRRTLPSRSAGRTGTARSAPGPDPPASARRSRATGRAACRPGRRGVLPARAARRGTPARPGAAAATTIPSKGACSGTPSVPSPTRTSTRPYPARSSVRRASSASSGTRSTVTTSSRELREDAPPGSRSRADLEHALPPWSPSASSMVATMNGCEIVCP